MRNMLKSNGLACRAIINGFLMPEEPNASRQVRSLATLAAHPPTTFSTAC
jgi:hypothetical protein